MVPSCLPMADATSPWSDLTQCDAIHAFPNMWCNYVVQPGHRTSRLHLFLSGVTWCHCHICIGTSRNGGHHAILVSSRSKPHGLRVRAWLPSPSNWGLPTSGDWALLDWNGNETQRNIAQNASDQQKPEQRRTCKIRETSSLDCSASALQKPPVCEDFSVWPALRPFDPWGLAGHSWRAIGDQRMWKFYVRNQSFHFCDENKRISGHARTIVCSILKLLVVALQVLSKIRM